MTAAFAALLPFGLWLAKRPEPLVSGLPEFHGRSQTFLINKFGKPDMESEFNVPTTGTLDEFRIGIHNTYPPDNPKNSAITIRELNWKDGEYNNTVWLHCPAGTWTVFNTCRWHKDVAF